MKPTLKILRDSSFILGFFTLVYSFYSLIAIYTPKSFVDSFFMGSCIVMFGFYVDILVDPYYKDPRNKNSATYKKVVCLGVSVLSAVGFTISQFSNI